MHPYLVGVVVGLAGWLVGSYPLDAALGRQTGHPVAALLRVHRLLLSGVLHAVVGVVIATLYSLSTISTTSPAGKGALLGALVGLAMVAAIQIGGMYFRTQRTVGLLLVIYWLTLTVLEGLVIGLWLQ